ncbi:MAG: mechanosensitive ion channel family protein [Candidatus Thermoplasmatota archaeon]|nr:mechanosensitive ion channel family protein [Candidatus Thermoplasmatota archaeon]
MSVLGIDMGGEAEFGSFSEGTATVLALFVMLSVGSGIFSRRMLFPWLMDLFSKSERIDGRDLFAPKSLAWMVGLLVLWQSIDWMFINTEPVWNADLMTDVMDFSRGGFVILMLFAAYRLVDYLDAFIVVEGDDMAARRSLASVAESIGRLAVVVIGFFVVAGRFGVNLNGLIAGLGITGLALALAARDSVANVFGAISIIIDQPFNVGDWIIVEDIEGEVMNIGLRTTMLRTGNDTIVTVPNSNITNSPVENYSKRRFRRIRPTFEFEEANDLEALKEFCDGLCKQVLADSRATKQEDSWVKVTQVLPSKVTVSCNFYCPSSGRIQREFTEDIILMARTRGEECGLNFHEPRRRAQM